MLINCAATLVIYTLIPVRESYLAQAVRQKAAPTEPIDELAAHLKAYSDPLRLEILRVLAQDSYGVLELSRIFATTQSGMSHHLKVLANAGLVASRREGNSIYYRRAPTGAQTQYSALNAALHSELDQLSYRTELQHQLDEIRQERAKASQEFFAANSEKFIQQQDLIASYGVYAQQVTELLDSIPLTEHTNALEIGPGQGEFLSVLSTRFEKVVAIDNSSRMLDKAHALVQQKQLHNVELLLGDSSSAVDAMPFANCVVTNMVLHHTPSPADIFHHASEVLSSNGALLVTDLCRHDQQWARESCGDLWLGFEPEDLSQWAADAQLNEGQSVYFALRNGFQIQIRHFYKV